MPTLKDLTQNTATYCCFFVLFFNSTCLVVMISVTHKCCVEHCINTVSVTHKYCVEHCINTISVTHKCCVAHCIITVSVTHKCCVAHCIITVSVTHLCCVHLFCVVLEGTDRLIACFLQDVKVMNNNKRNFKKSFLKTLSILCRL